MVVTVRGRRVGLLQSPCIIAVMASKVNLAEKFSLFTEHWSPKIVGELNGQHVKLVKFTGDFVWHSHATEDELFHVIKGRFRMDFRDRSEWIERGEFIIVPRGIEHKPFAEAEVEVLLFEPVSTLNTGNAGGDRTVQHPERLVADVDSKLRQK